MTSRLQVTQVKSPIGKKRNQRATLRSLGLHRVGDATEHTDTAGLRGMIDTVGHLITVEEVS